MTDGYSGRREDVRLLTGAGRYTADVDRPGQLHAVFVRSDRAHARLLRVDVGEALAVAGVRLVLTGADTLAEGWHRHQVLLPYRGRGNEALKVPVRPILAVERVRFVGEPVAVVVGESLAAALDGAERVMVAYETLEAVVSAEAALAAGAPVLHADVPGNLCFDFDYGDEAATAAAFAGAAHVVSVELVSDRVVGNPMEPKAAVAAWEGDVLDLWTQSQGMNGVRDSLAGLTGLPPERIRVRAQDVGGGFGIRGPAYVEHAALALAARRAGAPVKWVGTRSETFLSDYHGRGLVMRGSLALDGAGRFLAVRHAWVGDQGAYPVAVGPLINTLNPAMMCTGCYRIPAVYGRNRLAVTNTVPITAYRGAGRPDMAYVIERLVDEAAVQLGMDRVALRRLNMIPAEAFPYRLPTPGPLAATYDSGTYGALLDRATALADWDGFGARRAAAAAQGRLRGIGLALFVEPSGGVAPKDDVSVTFGPDDMIVINHVSGGSGQGHETVFPEIVARVLGVPAAGIVLRANDPDGPALVGGGAFASRTSLSHGAATHLAALEVVEKARALAAETLEAAASDLEYGAGMFRVAGTDRSVALMTLVRQHRGEGAHPLDTLTTLPATRAYPSGAHVVEVEVDPETGVVAVLRYVAVDDCGTVLNHTLLEGQITGGMLQGVGQVLGEQGAYDSDGQFLTGSFMDYVMPRADALRDVRLDTIMTPSPNNVLGVKGAGEAGTTGALPATMNAIMDALRVRGVSALDMPATPQAVWRVLQETGR